MDRQELNTLAERYAGRNGVFRLVEDVGHKRALRQCAPFNSDVAAGFQRPDRQMKPRGLALRKSRVA